MSVFSDPLQSVFTVVMEKPLSGDDSPTPPVIVIYEEFNIVAESVPDYSIVGYWENVGGSTDKPDVVEWCWSYFELMEISLKGLVEDIFNNPIEVLVNDVVVETSMLLVGDMGLGNTGIYLTTIATDNFQDGVSYNIKIRKKED